MAGGCAGQTPSQAGGAGDRPAALRSLMHGTPPASLRQISWRNWRAAMLPQRA